MFLVSEASTAVDAVKSQYVYDNEEAKDATGKLLNPLESFETRWYQLVHPF